MLREEAAVTGQPPNLLTVVYPAKGTHTHCLVRPVIRSYKQETLLKVR